MMGSEIPTMLYLMEVAEITKGKEVEEVVLPLSELIKKYLNGDWRGIPKPDKMTCNSDDDEDMVNFVNGHNYFDFKDAIVYDDMSDNAIEDDFEAGIFKGKFYPVIEELFLSKEDGEYNVLSYAKDYNYGEDDKLGVYVEVCEDEDEDETVYYICAATKSGNDIMYVENGRWTIA